MKNRGRWMQRRGQPAVRRHRRIPREIARRCSGHGPPILARNSRNRNRPQRGSGFQPRRRTLRIEPDRHRLVSGTRRTVCLGKQTVLVRSACRPTHRHARKRLRQALPSCRPNDITTSRFLRMERAQVDVTRARGPVSVAAIGFACGARRECSWPRPAAIWYLWHPSPSA